MGEYKPLDEVISNENVIKVLRSSMLPDEDSLLAEVSEKNELESAIKIYVTSKLKDEMTYLAEVIRKKDKLGINNWYVNFKESCKS
ncbi:MAG: hypothetical protein PHH54_04390 [Candidatus Nanoarchaeia archaeon]|nr:hypothetical protein [Candidatus Nanoarchaeia archaeon]MDD5741199.1 hypothetical protein [Candidatus Nanoarchaeia archaeon]